MAALNRATSGVSGMFASRAECIIRYHFGQLATVIFRIFLGGLSLMIALYTQIGVVSRYNRIKNLPKRDR
jgi:hypothetical protein